MSNFLCFIALALVGIILQSTVLAYVGVWGLRVELLLILLTHISLNYSLLPGIFLVTALGYLYDLSSAAPFGLHILTYLLIFVVLFLIRNRLYIQGPAFCVGLVVFLVVFEDFFARVLLTSRGVASAPSISEIALLVPKAFFTGAFWPLVFPVLEKVNHRFAIPSREHKRSFSFDMKF